MNDLNSCIRTMWAGILFVAWGIKKAAGYIAKWSDIISNDTIATIVHWIAFGIVIAVILAVLGFVVVIAVVKIKDAYKSYCWDKVTVIVTAVSLAIIVWFGELIKAVMPYTPTSNRSKTTLIAHAMDTKINGLLLSPKPLRIAENALYPKINTVPNIVISR